MSVLQILCLRPKVCRYMKDIPQEEPVERDAYQTGMEWLPLEKAKKANLFPRVIRDNLSSLIGMGETIYLGSERRGGGYDYTGN